MPSIQRTDIFLLINSAVAANPDDPAPITTTSGLDCEKEILGNAIKASPDKEVFKNFLLPVLSFKNFFRTKFYTLIKINTA
tara:strand:+ start:535 stop:777 length:243 start_codon:yes stop_codon:yes gene_type:complete